jgi:SAM-dependent methyltransferase
MKEFLRSRFILPQYNKGFDLDDPGITEMRRGIIMGKPFLRKLYEEWYTVFKEKLSTVPAGKVVEIGSGAGFIKEILPEVITSDIMPLSTCDMVFSAEDMPFKVAELSGIVMIDVLHHIPTSAEFFKEAERTLKQGGKIIMTEPANSSWGYFIYTRFHHEPFNPKGNWEIPSTGPLSGANGALPWIIFERDRKKFETDYPGLQIKNIKYHTPLRYLLSGGVSMRTLVPDWSFGFFKLFEGLFSPLGKYFSMFMTIEIERN